MTIEQNRGSVVQPVTSTTDELEQLEMAGRMAKETIEFYKKAAVEITDPVGKLFLNVLSGLRKNTYSFISDTDNWFMWISTAS